jgi:voltage-gated potassium channel
MNHIVEGLILILASVFIHSTGTLLFLLVMEFYGPWWEKHGGVLVNTVSLTWVVSTLVFLHLFEIAVYALFYYAEGILPDLDTAAYFSLATYTTVGYGDVVLAREWRLFGASEALVGILMTAWSTAVLIGVVTTLHRQALERLKIHAGSKQRPKSHGEGS